MKHLVSFSFVSVLLACMFSCKPAEIEHAVPANVAKGTLSLTVAEKSGPLTKADPSAYTVSQDYERRINSIEILVFYRGGAQDGILAHSERLTNSSATFSMTRQYDLAVGDYTVCAYVNGAAELSAAQKASLSSFHSVAVALADNSVSESAGFVMSGESTTSVAESGTNTCEVSLQRVLNRVVINKISNNLASGSLTVKRVWLANIVTGQNVSNNVSGNDRTWAHQFSRAASPWTGSALISSFTASALTSKAPNAVIANGGNVNAPASYLLYAFANLKSASAAEDALVYLPAAIAWAPTKTRVVIEASINDVNYYYPYDLTLGSRNQTNTLDFVISGLGLDDPQGDPGDLARESLSVSISVADWVPGENKEIVY